jgi:hypothetical protein
MPGKANEVLPYAQIFRDINVIFGKEDITKRL